MSRIQTLQTRLLLSEGSTSPLGRIKLAGTIQGSSGIGRPKMRLLDSYALVYILRGGGEYKDALGTHRRVRQGNLFWLFPDVPHGYGPLRGDQWDEIYFVFEGSLFDLWRQQNVIAPERPIWKLKPIDFWLRRLEEITRSASPAGWEGAFHQLSQFQGVVADMLLASSNARNPAADRGWLTRACRHLEATGPAAPDLEKVAQAVGLSYETFRKKFVQRIGMAPAKYHQARVIERACTLLMQRSHSHKEIAQQLGFCDEFHFSKTFRRYMGFSPLAFRLKTLGSAPK